MEDLDTAKVREILEYMKEFGAVFLKYNELIIEFPRPDKSPVTDGIGFQATADGDDEETETETEETTQPMPVIVTGAGNRIPVGYAALFKDRQPKFSVPSATGNTP